MHETKLVLLLRLTQKENWKLKFYPGRARDVRYEIAVENRRVLVNNIFVMTPVFTYGSVRDTFNSIRRVDRSFEYCNYYCSLVILWRMKNHTPITIINIIMCSAWNNNKQALEPWTEWPRLTNPNIHEYHYITTHVVFIFYYFFFYQPEFTWLSRKRNKIYFIIVILKSVCNFHRYTRALRALRARHMCASIT